MATTDIDTVSTSADKAKLAATGLLVVGGVAAFYLLGKQDLWLRVVTLLVLIAAGVAVFFTSAQGKELVAYAEEGDIDARPVPWRHIAQFFPLLTPHIQGPYIVVKRIGSPFQFRTLIPVAPGDVQLPIFF